MTKKQITLLGLTAAITVLILGIVSLRPKTDTNKMVVISGLQNCSKGIDAGIIDGIGTGLYGYVQQANDYNKKATEKTYKAIVRDGSCGIGTDHTTKGVTGLDVLVHTSSAIIDIPSAEQSWKVSYDWTAGGKAKQTDLGTISPTCLSVDDLLYGDFNCDKVLNIQKYGTATYDPILEYMPYTGEGFTLAYDASSKLVTATLMIPVKEKGNQELLQNSKAIVPYWFEHRGLNISNYTVTYEVLYE